MSTYTDLKNTIKETINVDYKGRETLQEVAFKNANNTYWGTFKGSIDAENSFINNAVISDSIIYDSILKDSVLSTDKGIIDLGNIETEFEELSERTDALEIKDVELESRISTLEKNTVTTKVLANVSVALDTKIDNVSSFLDDKIEGVSAESDINDCKLSNEISTRYDFLIDRIDTVDDNSKTRDRNITESLTSHIADNEAEFANVYSTIDRDTHYQIAVINQTKYPYQIKDRCINRISLLNTSAGELRFAGKIVGELYKKDGAVNSFKIFDISDTRFAKLNQAVESGRTYDVIESTEETKIETPVENGYMVSYYGGQLHFVNHGENYLEFTAFNMLIGRVTNFYPATEVGKAASSILSGNIYINTHADPILSTFNIGKTTFKTSGEGSEISYNNNALKFESDNKVHMDYNLKRDYKCDIVDTDNTYFGYILSNDVVYGDSNQISAFRVYLDGLTENSVNLISSNGFTVESEERKIVSYDSALSTITLVDDIYYSYNYKYSSTEPMISVTIGQKNTHLSNDLRGVEQMSANIFDPTPAFNRVYVLSADDSIYSSWSTVLTATVESEKQTISVYFDGGKIIKRVYNDTHTIDITMPYYLDRSSEYRSSLISRTSKPITFAFDQLVETPERRIEAHYGPLVKNDAASTETLEVQVYENDNLPVKFYVPEDFDDPMLSASSKEFILTTKIISENKKYVEFKFFKPDGIDDGESDIKIYNDKLSTLFVPTNNFYSYKFHEVQKDCFLLVDLNHHELSVDIKKLTDDLNSETSSRIDSDLHLSAAISANSLSIADLYKQVEGGLVYKDTLSINVSPYYNDQYKDNTILSNMLFNNFKRKYGIDDLSVLNLPLHNGFYYISENSHSKSELCVIGGLNIKHGDLIVFKNNTLLQNATSVDVNIIDIMDTDAVHEDRLCEVSAFLSADYHQQIGNLSTSLSNTVELSVEALQSQIVSNDYDISHISSQIDSICSDISTALTTLSGEVSAISTEIDSRITTNANNVSKLSVDIYKNVDSGLLSERGLSGKVEFLLSSDHKAMDYGGTLKSIDVELPPGKYEYNLSDFLIDNGFLSTGFLKTGFMFRLSAEQTFIPQHPIGSATSSYIFCENDYFIVNKDVIVKDIVSTDIDIIYDAKNECLKLSDDLSTLSKYATNIELSANEISIKLNEICAEISDYVYLSLELSVSEISTAIGNLCTEISNEITSISQSVDELSNTVSSLCSGLSIDLSSLTEDFNDLSGHYGRTFIEKHIPKHNKNDVSADKIVILDDGFYEDDKYYMTFLSGTLVLNKLEM